MGGVFSFLGGLLSLGASAGMAIKEDMEQEARNREYLSHNYAPIIQSKYDDAEHKLWQAYNYEKVVAAIRQSYPNMSDGWAYKIAKAAVAKTLMEKETSYEYQIPESIITANVGDITRFVNDDMKMPTSIYDYFIEED